MTNIIKRVLLTLTLFSIYGNTYAQDTIGQINKGFHVDSTSLESTKNFFKPFLWDKPLSIHFENEERDSNKLHNGQPAPDFTLTDISGNKISLKDFKGKIVYLDFWETSCKPCVAEIPEAKKLEEEFKTKDVVFIYISIDQNEIVWRKIISEKQMMGIQLISVGGFSSEIAQIYKLKGVPTYILINKAGIIIDSDAKRPSAGAKQDIKKLLN